jgi:3-hydroxy-9,10-secoandrosta-1,3,5(10)-triene-9,17-dione monooxygenase
MIAVARGCPSSGWVLALTAGHPQMLSRFAERTQAEIYGNAGHVRAPLRPVPGGQAEKCDGGYLVSGAWDYASGCDHATHFIGAAVVAGSNPPKLIYALLDRSAFVIIDNWNTIGMRGTGSKRVAAERVFVPQHRIITAPNIGRDRAGMAYAREPILFRRILQFVVFRDRRRGDRHRPGCARCL